MHQASDFAALDAKAASGDLVGYIGFDCTAKSLHVGSLLQIMLLQLAAAQWRQTDRADGRRHHPRRRSLRQGRDA